MLIDGKYFPLMEAADPPAGGGGNPNDPPSDPPSDPPADTPNDPPADPNDPPADPPADPPKKGDEPEGYWPADWRERLAGEDEKELKRLGRYATPEDVNKARSLLEKKLSSGELSSKLSDEPTDEELAGWRKENGIPEKAEDYEISVEVKDEEKEGMDVALTAMHELNLNPSQVNGVIALGAARREAMEEDQRNADISAGVEAEDTLREDWGPEYRRNLNIVHNYLDVMGGENLKDQLLHGRLADGQPIGSSPEALKLILGSALVHNPAGTVVPNNGGDQMDSIAEEISAIETFMKDNRPAYNKDAKKQERLRTLYDAREKLKPKS